MGLLYIILVGAVAGFFAGLIVKGRGLGFLMNLLIGIIGALVGGWLLGALGVTAYGLLGNIISATIGAVILLLIINLLRKP
jgi:uncharacterized membrane protein YeaQ/YmgE (transglycosylase-associated protein family)